MDNCAHCNAPYRVDEQGRCWYCGCRLENVQAWPVSDAAYSETAVTFSSGWPFAGGYGVVAHRPWATEPVEPVEPRAPDPASLKHQLGLALLPVFDRLFRGAQ